MTDVGARTRDTGRKGRKGDQRGNFVTRMVASLRLFVSQILDELRKVVRPTRAELWQYTLVVIVFVVIIMAIVSSLDFGFSKLVALVFGG